MSRPNGESQRRSSVFKVRTRHQTRNQSASNNRRNFGELLIDRALRKIDPRDWSLRDAIVTQMWSASGDGGGSPGFTTTPDDFPRRTPRNRYPTALAVWPHTTTICLKISVFLHQPDGSMGVDGLSEARRPAPFQAQPNRSSSLVLGAQVGRAGPHGPPYCSLLTPSPRGDDGPFHRSRHPSRSCDRCPGVRRRESFGGKKAISTEENLRLLVRIGRALRSAYRHRMIAEGVVKVLFALLPPASRRMCPPPRSPPPHSERKLVSSSIALQNRADQNTDR